MEDEGAKGKAWPSCPLFCSLRLLNQPQQVMAPILHHDRPADVMSKSAMIEHPPRTDLGGIVNTNSINTCEYALRLPRCAASMLGV